VALAALLFPCGDASTQDANTVTRPTLDVSATGSRQSIERGERLQIDVIVDNASDAAVEDVRLRLMSQGFAAPAPIDVPTLPPYSSLVFSWNLQPRGAAAFGAHRLQVLANYAWRGEGKTFHSVASASVEVLVKRRFEDALGGFLGGAGAAALFFLLPIYPAFAAYHWGESLRKGEKLSLPDLTAGHRLPLAVVAILVVLLLQAFNTPFTIQSNDDLLQPDVFVKILALSLLIGSLKPAVHAAIDLREERTWGFTGKETMPDYVKKAMTGPRGKARFPTAEVKSNGDIWKGLLLAGTEKSREVVLGTPLQLNVEDAAVQPGVAQMLTNQGVVTQPESLVQLIQRNDALADGKKQVTIEPRERVRKVQGDEEIPAEALAQIVKNDGITLGPQQPIICLMPCEVS
jgi:hypothetical protein